jgi:hypothetical protein
MYDAVITFVTYDESTDPHIGSTITKVFRLEFENEQLFHLWLEQAQEYGVAIEQLTGA